MSTLLLDQLPVVMAADSGIAQFLGIVDPIASQLYDVVGAKEVYFDPTVAPLPMLRWLAQRLGAEIDSHLPDAVQRSVFLVTAATYAMRGTPTSLRMNIGAITGAVVSIVEDGWIASRPVPQHPPTSTDTPTESAPFVPAAVTIHVSTLGHATLAQISATIERELRGDVVYRIVDDSALQPTVEVAA